VVKQIADSEAAFEAMTVKHNEQMSPLYIRRWRDRRDPQTGQPSPQ
jgi:hypothetical protein